MAWPGNGQALGGFVEEFTDKDDWIVAVGDFTTIGFTGFPGGTFITDQYADLGILFTDGNDSISPFDPITYPEDGWGLESSSPNAWTSASEAAGSAISASVFAASQRTCCRLSSSAANKPGTEEEPTSTSALRAL